MAQGIKKVMPPTIQKVKVPAPAAIADGVFVMKKMINTYVAIKPSGPATFGIALTAYPSDANVPYSSGISVDPFVGACADLSFVGACADLSYNVAIFPPLSSSNLRLNRLVGRLTPP